MSISKKILRQLEESSWIRRMFEEGIELKKRVGADQVCDLSLGNPILEPPTQFFAALRNLLSQPPSGRHRYMENLGWRELRSQVAKYLKREWELDFNASHIAFTVGAAGGISLALKVLLDAGDEVVFFSPYFPEYTYYIDAHGGKSKIIPCQEDFDLDLEQLEKELTPEVKVILLNSPNNPTGKIYSQETLDGLAEILEAKSREFGRAIYIISDEPYRTLLYTEEPYPAPIQHYRNTISITSFSKALSIPGERIGYMTIHPEMEGTENFMEGVKLAMRALGFVNAPSLMQHILPDLLDVTIDVDHYRKNRDLLGGALLDSGYELEIPEGAFYLFPRAPGGDDLSFVDFLKEKYYILTVPGRGFGWPGCFRISYCVEPEVLEKSIPGFEKALSEFRGGKQ